MTWIDLIAWSPAVYKELKRLCTRVLKKKMKGKKPAAQQQKQPNPFSQFNPQYNPQFNTQFNPQFNPLFQQQAPQMPQQPIPI